MDDLISRQAAIDGKICIQRANGAEIYDDYAVPVEYLKQLPPANCSEFPNNSDAISRQAAIDAVNCVTVMKGIRSGKSITAEAVDCAKRIIADNIRQLPPIQPKLLQPWEVLAAQAVLSQPAEPKREKWNRLDMDTFNCNKCGATFVLSQGSEKMHFCPNCGAKMEVTE